jgi:GT2 family glycosyltransferase
MARVGRVGPRVAVVIPNWNGAVLLPACLAALRAQTYPHREVVVVDNGSRDASLAVLARYPEVRVLRFGRNRGFGAATNAGIRATDAPYVATLNNDAVPAPGWLAALVAAAETDPRIGMCASRMVFAQRPDVLNSCGIALDRTGIAWDLHGGEPVGADRDLAEPFGPCAGAALYRRALFDQVGLFAERFFAYLEDVDLAWRARRAGWRCRYVPAAVVAHHHSATAGEGSAQKRFLLGRNKVWLLARNYPTAALWRWLPLVVAYDLAAVAYALVVRRETAALRGRLAGLAGLPAALRERRHLVPPAASAPTGLLPPVAPWAVPRRYAHLAALAGTGG